MHGYRGLCLRDMDWECHSADIAMYKMVDGEDDIVSGRKGKLVLWQKCATFELALHLLHSSITQTHIYTALVWHN